MVRAAARHLAPGCMAGGEASGDIPVTFSGHLLHSMARDSGHDTAAQLSYSPWLRFCVHAGYGPATFELAQPQYTDTAWASAKLNFCWG